MKRTTIIIMVLSLMVAALTQVFALSEIRTVLVPYSPEYEARVVSNLMNEYAKVSQHTLSYEDVRCNIKKLREWGMPEERMLTLTIDDVRTFLRDLTREGMHLTLSENEKITTKETTPLSTERELELELIQRILKEKGLTIEQFNSLINMSNDIDDIIAMSNAEIADIFSGTTTPPSKGLHTYYGNIPYFGGDGSTAFDTSINISSTYIQNYCNLSKDFSEYVLNRTYNNASTYSSQNIRFSYYLFGEYDNQIGGVHEGVDIHDANGSDRAIRSAHPGKIIGVGGTYGVVQVFDDFENWTVTYMHLDTSANGYSVDDYINRGSNLGNQDNTGLPSTSGNHLHTQVVFGETTNTPSGQNMTLSSEFPYYVLTWYLP